MLTVGKRFSNRWQAQASYVHSKSEGTMNNTIAVALQADTSCFY